MTYSWAEGYYSRTDPEKIGPLFASLLKQGKTAEEILDLAKGANKRSKYYLLRRELWVDESDAKLADTARLDRTRTALRAIQITVTGGETKRLTFAAEIVRTEPREYVLRQQALSNLQMRNQMVLNGRRMLETFMRSYGDLKEFRPIVDEIDKFLNPPKTSRRRKAA